jgi:integrase
MAPNEAREIIDRATGQLQLHLLLMANCGMTQKDIADLQQNEVDWEKGRIIRKRSKTKNQKSVPTVSYKLWPDTLALLRVYGSSQGGRVLLTRRGNRWVFAEFDEKLGKLVSSDPIATNYDHLRRKLKKEGKEVGTLKLFRKTSATLLYNSDEYSTCVGAFLGHAPDSIITRHYAHTSAEKLDKAVAWLATQYGFEPNSSG